MHLKMCVSLFNYYAINFSSLSNFQESEQISLNLKYNKYRKSEFERIGFYHLLLINYIIITIKILQVRFFFKLPEK